MTLRRFRLAVTVAVAVVVLMAGAITPVVAHEGAGTLTLESADPANALAVRYRVRLVYTADGHPVPDATVTAVAVGPTSATPVPFTEAADGVYEGTVTFPAPGDWSVRFTSVTPAATLEHAQTIVASTSTSSTTATTTTPTTDPGRGKANAGADDDGGGGNGNGALVVVAALVALALIGATTAVRRHRST